MDEVREAPGACDGDGRLLVGLTAWIGSVPAWAGSKTATISFGTIESVARAANGDTVTINGEGTFALQPKSISGDGGAVAEALGEVPRTFTHRDAQGNVLIEAHMGADGGLEL